MSGTSILDSILSFGQEKQNKVGVLRPTHYCGLLGH
jgi:hypothetical protein